MKLTRVYYSNKWRFYQHYTGDLWPVASWWQDLSLLRKKKTHWWTYSVNILVQWSHWHCTWWPLVVGIPCRWTGSKSLWRNSRYLIVLACKGILISFIGQGNIFSVAFISKLTHQDHFCMICFLSGRILIRQPATVFLGNLLL